MVKKAKTYIYVALFIILISSYNACENIFPFKDGFELTQSTCIKASNTINCPDSSLFNILSKGRAFGPVGTYLLIICYTADSTSLDCGSWTFDSNGTIIGCFRNSDQDRETEFIWKGFITPCLPQNAYYEDIEYSVATNTSLLAPFYLFEDFTVSCRP